MHNALGVPAALGKWESGYPPRLPQGPYGSPLTWTPQLASTLSADVVSFDFIVNWSARRVDDRVLLKMTGSRGILNDMWDDPAQISRHLSVEAKQQVAQLGAACAHLGLELEIVAFPEPGSVEYWQKRGDDANAALCYSFTPATGFHSARRWSMKQLMDEIKSRRGGEWRIGDKGLTWATSSLEKHLSTTNYMWPGDCDGLAIRGGHPLAVIEWKRHNLTSDISTESFAAHYFGDTNNKPKDRKKWDALAYLATRFQVPIVAVCWPSFNAGTKALVEVISGAPGRLKVLQSTRVPLAAGTATDKQHNHQNQNNLIAEISGIVDSLSPAA